MIAAENTITVGLSLIMNSVTLPSEKKLVTRWLNEYTRKSHQDRQKQKILAALADGYDTVEEIAEHTAISYSTARRILLEFIKHKKVRSDYLKRRSNRPDRIFSLIEV